MKVRNGFVSNSSSSSYIIKIHNQEPCPHCGRSTPNIVDHIKNANNYSCETHMVYSSRENVLGDIDAEIHRIQKDIKEYSALRPNEVPPRFRAWSDYNPTAKQCLEQAHRELEYCRDRRDKIEAVEGELYGIAISYHDEYTKSIFDAGVEDGSIEIVEDHN